MDLARDRNVPSGVTMLAKKLVEKKTAPKKEEKQARAAGPLRSLRESRGDF
ncbi:hypothetical protein [Hyalangium sp.]|uniref:hypothetical protein n=1 Tax=Hyalangium sp. TaxID=2028555 RepID=UPI00389B0814